MSYEKELEMRVYELAFDELLDAYDAEGVEKGVDPDEQLYGDLHACIAARDSIELEQAKLVHLAERTEDQLEKEYRLYQADLIEMQITRAARIAEIRLAHLETLQSEEDWAEERERCKNGGEDSRGKFISGAVHFFRQWAFAYEPRAVLKVLPMYPFPFQEELINELDAAVFVTRDGRLVEKSRDMTVTWTCAGWNIYHFLFTEFFSALVGNRTEDDIDSKKGDIDTNFEKMRFILRRLPRKLLPKGFDPYSKNDTPYMNLSNPENGANISGAAPTIDFGRGKRRTVIQPDEYASWVQGSGYPQYAAMAQATNSIIPVSTPKGMFNRFADLKFSSQMKVVRLHWTRHPWKMPHTMMSLNADKFFELKGYRPTIWRDTLDKPYNLGLTAEQIAQEVEIDYEASQPGKVVPMFSPAHHCITVSEFERVYKTLEITRLWNWARVMDCGTTEDHPNITTYTTRPGKGYPWQDTCFVMAVHFAMTGISIGEVVEGVKDEVSNALLHEGLKQLEARILDVQKIVLSKISHEASSEKKTMEKDVTYKTWWEKLKPDANGGISQMVNAFTLLAEPHPFVVHPVSGEALAGRPRLILVVPDECKLFIDPQTGCLTRKLPNDKGLRRAWEEILAYHYPVSEKGKAVSARKPFNLFNDFMDTLRNTMSDWGPTTADKTFVQKFEEALPEALRVEALKEVTDAEELSEKFFERQLLIDEQDLKAKIGRRRNWRQKLTSGEK